MPDDTDQWGVYNLHPTVTSDYVTVTGLDVRTAGDTGFKGFRIYAQERKTSDSLSNIVPLMSPPIIIADLQLLFRDKQYIYIHIHIHISSSDS